MQALPYIAIAMQAAGKGVSGLSGANETKAEAALREMEGRSALDRSEREASALAKRNRRIVAKQVAGFGASGIELVGSPADLIVQDAIQGELDVMTAEKEGQAVFRAKKFEARQLRRKAKAQIKATILDIGGKALGSVGGGAGGTASAGASSGGGGAAPGGGGGGGIGLTGGQA